MMMKAIARIAFAVAAPLLLTSCFLTPGKFTSKLTVNADRSFTFAYQGEVIALDPSDEMGKGLDLGGDADADPEAAADGDAAEDAAAAAEKAAEDAAQAKDKAEKAAEKERKLRAMAEALRKEHGYKSVEYKGNNTFVVDYQISGTLTHSFVFPFNFEAEAPFPFLAIEVRGPDLVRVHAPGFGNDSSEGPMGGGSSRRTAEGVFTVETDAEIVSQNNEDGAKTVAGRKTIAWTVTPLTKIAPTAVLRLGKR